MTVRQQLQRLPLYAVSYLYVLPMFLTGLFHDDEISPRSSTEPAGPDFHRHQFGRRTHNQISTILLGHCRSRLYVSDERKRG